MYSISAFSIDFSLSNTQATSPFYATVTDISETQNSIVGSRLWSFENNDTSAIEYEETEGAYVNKTLEGIEGTTYEISMSAIFDRSSPLPAITSGDIQNLTSNVRIGNTSLSNTENYKIYQSLVKRLTPFGSTSAVFDLFLYKEPFPYSTSALVGIVSGSNENGEWVTITSANNSELYGDVYFDWNLNTTSASKGVWGISGTNLAYAPVLTNENATFIRMDNVPELITGSGSSYISASTLINDVARYGKMTDILHDVVASPGSLYVSNPILSAGNNARYGKITDGVGNPWASGTTISTLTINGLAYRSPNNIWVAVGDNRTLAYSFDGKATWTSAATPGFANSSDDIRAVVYASSLGLFIATGTLNQICTSTSGTVWTVRSAGAPAGNNMYAATWSGSRAVVVGNGATSIGRLLYSDNGTAWTSVSITSATSLRGITWFNDRFVAVDNSGGVFISSAAESGTWFHQTSGSTTGSYNAICHNGSRLVAVGAAGLIRISDNGASSWTTVSPPTASSLVTIVWTGRWFVATGDAIAFKSVDGLNWVNISTNMINSRASEFVYPELTIAGTLGQSLISNEVIITSAFSSSATRLSGTSALGAATTSYAVSFPSTVTIAPYVTFTLASVSASNLSASFNFDIETRSTGNFLNAVYSTSGDRTSGTSATSLGFATSAYSSTPTTLLIPNQLSFHVNPITSGNLPLDYNIITQSGIFNTSAFSSDLDRSVPQFSLGSTSAFCSSTPKTIDITNQLSFNVQSLSASNLPLNFNVVLTSAMYFYIPNVYEAISQLIELCGPADPYLLEDNKTLDIKNYLPDFLKEGELNDLMIFFENFLNDLYYQYSLTTISATPYQLDNRPKMSILEKINRLTQFHDSELIDINYIQFFANYLGYNIDLNKGEIGIPQGTNAADDLCYQEDVKRYTRFIVQNLPNWYKIKATNNAVKIMLYSFGLIGDLVERWTSNYSDNENDWINFKNTDDYANIPQGYYPTSHFLIGINLDTSTSTFLNPNLRNNVFNAINSIRPVNTVFDSFLGYMHRSANLYLHAMVTHRYYNKFSTDYIMETEDDEIMITEDGLEMIME